MADPMPQISVSGKREEEEKKRSGFGWWFNAARGGSTLARGGLGAGGGLTGFLATTAGKTLIMLLCAALGSAAFVTGRIIGPNPNNFLLGRRNHVGAEKQSYGDVSGLPTYPKSPKDSLGYVAGGSDMYGRAPQAAGTADSGSAADAGKPGDAGAPAATGQPQGDKTAQDADAIARAMAAANGGKAGEAGGPDAGKKSAFGSKIGELSALGASGGGHMMAAAPSGPAPASDRSHGALSAFSNGSRAGTEGANSRATSRKVGGRNAFGELRNAAYQSGGAATATSAEAQKDLATSAFQGAGSGGAITGLGTGTGGGGITPGSSKGTEFGSGGPTGSGGGTPGAISENGTPAQSNCDVMSQDVGMTLISGSSGGCVPDPGAQNATPWQGLVNMAMLLMIIAGLVLVAAEGFGKLGNGNPTMKMIAQILAYVACALGALVAFIGMMIMGQGQMMQGLVYTGVGAVIAVMAFMAAQGMHDGTVQAAAQNSTAATSAQGALAPGAPGAPAAAPAVLQGPAAVPAPPPVIKT